MTTNFRNYSLDPNDPVYKFYLKNHTFQTLDKVLLFKSKYNSCDKYIINIFDAISLLDDIVDTSDPDIKVPQIYHCIEAGEAARQLHPEEEYDWFHLTAFIHDLGKILAHSKYFALDYEFVVGDTYPVGCKFNDKIIYHDFFKHNIDNTNTKLCTELGIYDKNIGFENVHMSYSHDEYLYQVLTKNSNNLPSIALYIIRFHSFYSWHQEQAYSYLASENDKKNLDWLKKFQQCDLYSKTDKIKSINIDDYLPYYKKIIKKYFPNQILKW